MADFHITQNTASAYGVSAEPQPAQPGVLDDLDYALNDLGGLIDELHGNLHPYLRPSEPQTGDDVADTGPISPIRQRIYHVHQLAGALRGIQHRLEI